MSAKDAALAIACQIHFFSTILKRLPQLYCINETQDTLRRLLEYFKFLLPGKIVTCQAENDRRGLVGLVSLPRRRQASSRARPPRVTSLLGSGGRDEKAGGTFVNLPAAVFSVSFRPSEARTKPGRRARQNRAKMYEGNERKRLPLRQVLCLGKGKQIEREGKEALPLPFTPEILTYFFCSRRWWPVRDY